jgi:U4/U6 small nuclear ribonucleoprotein PRP3
LHSFVYALTLVCLLGTYVNLEDRIRNKEERKIIAGYASGRKAPEQIGGDDDESIDVSQTAVNERELPAPVDGGVVPSMEWWDEVFLSKDLRELRKSSRAAAEIDNYDKTALTNCKTYKYIQHPVPIKPLGGEIPEAPLPMFLTKKERKRIRKQSRAAREQEKRDKQMLGLIPAPEVKFKLSNFMKILGDQAVADPSKVEMKVMEQVQKRQLNHEMRNLASKLTPAEKRAKMIRRNQEDTSRQVHTAVYRVNDLSNPRHRFKVDVNAQQYFLSGTVILCPDADCNIVVVEGGPRGIRRFMRLMLYRINWSEKVLPRSEDNESSEQVSLSHSNLADQAMDEEDSDEEDDEGDEEEKLKAMKSAVAAQGNAASNSDESNLTNSCRLVWQGIIPKRIFTGFRFQVCCHYDHMYSHL